MEELDVDYICLEVATRELSCFSPTAMWSFSGSYLRGPRAQTRPEGCERFDCIFVDAPFVLRIETRQAEALLLALAANPVHMLTRCHIPRFVAGPQFRISTDGMVAAFAAAGIQSVLLEQLGMKMPLAEACRLLSTVCVARQAALSQPEVTNQPDESLVGEVVAPPATAIPVQPSCQVILDIAHSMRNPFVPGHITLMSIEPVLREVSGAHTGELPGDLDVAVGPDPAGVGPSELLDSEVQDLLDARADADALMMDGDDGTVDAAITAASEPRGEMAFDAASLCVDDVVRKRALRLLPRAGRTTVGRRSSSLALRYETFPLFIPASQYCHGTLTIDFPDEDVGACMTGPSCSNCTHVCCCECGQVGDVGSTDGPDAPAPTVHIQSLIAYSMVRTWHMGLPKAAGGIANKFRYQGLPNLYRTKGGLLEFLEKLAGLAYCFRAGHKLSLRESAGGIRMEARVCAALPVGRPTGTVTALEYARELASAVSPVLTLPGLQHHLDVQYSGRYESPLVEGLQIKVQTLPLTAVAIQANAACKLALSVAEGLSWSRSKQGNPKPAPGPANVAMMLAVSALGISVPAWTGVLLRLRKTDWECAGFRKVLSTWYRDLLQCLHSLCAPPPPTPGPQVLLVGHEGEDEQAPHAPSPEPGPSGAVYRHELPGANVGVSVPVGVMVPGLQPRGSVSQTLPVALSSELSPGPGAALLPQADLHAPFAVVMDGGDTGVPLRVIDCDVLLAKYSAFVEDLCAHARWDVGHRSSSRWGTWALKNTGGHYLAKARTKAEVVARVLVAHPEYLQGWRSHIPEFNPSEEAASGSQRLAPGKELPFTALDLDALQQMGLRVKLTARLESEATAQAAGLGSVRRVTWAAEWRRSTGKLAPPKHAPVDCFTRLEALAVAYNHCYAHGLQASWEDYLELVPDPEPPEASNASADPALAVTGGLTVDHGYLPGRAMPLRFSKLSERDTQTAARKISSWVDTGTPFRILAHSSSEVFRLSTCEGQFNLMLKRAAAKAYETSALSHLLRTGTGPCQPVDQALATMRRPHPRMTPRRAVLPPAPAEPDLGESAENSPVPLPEPSIGEPPDLEFESGLVPPSSSKHPHRTAAAQGNKKRTAAPMLLPPTSTRTRTRYGPAAAQLDSNSQPATSPPRPVPQPRSKGRFVKANKSAPFGMDFASEASRQSRRQQTVALVKGASMVPVVTHAPPSAINLPVPGTNCLLGRGSTQDAPVHSAHWQDTGNALLDTVCSNLKRPRIGSEPASGTSLLVDTCHGAQTHEVSTAVPVTLVASDRPLVDSSESDVDLSDHDEPCGLSPPPSPTHTDLLLDRFEATVMSTSIHVVGPDLGNSVACFRHGFCCGFEL